MATAQCVEGLCSAPVLQADAGVGRCRWRHPRPRAARVEHPGVGLVGEGGVQHVTSRRWMAGSCTGTITSTRRSRLRSIMSGEPKLIRSGRPWSPPNRKIRECSRNRPTTERDPDGLGQAGHPGPQPAPAPHHEVDRRARRRRPVEGVDDLGVGQPVGLQHDPALGPAAASASMAATTSARVVSGDTTSRRRATSVPDPVRRLNTSATSAPMSGSAVSRPMSS